MFYSKKCNDFSKSCLYSRGVKIKEFSMSESDNKVGSLIVLAMIFINVQL